MLVGKSVATTATQERFGLLRFGLKTCAAGPNVSGRFLRLGGMAGS